MAQNANQNTSKPFSYILYLYRNELRKPDRSWISSARSKFQLTDELIAHTVRNMDKCSPEDLVALDREREFNNLLYDEIARTIYHQNMQKWKMHQQEKKLKIKRAAENSQVLQQQNQSHYQQEETQQEDHESQAKRSCCNDIRSHYTQNTLDTRIT